MRAPPISALGPLLRQWRSLWFSQYGEDAILSALRPRSTGTYVDVGAHHPWRGSNTYKLYLKGWTGLTIEPNPDHAAAFSRFRPRDQHLVMGVAAEASTLVYHRFRDSRLNSFQPDPYHAAQPRDGEPVAIACMPLREIVRERLGDGPIDLLSVDCEGLDHAVLASLDWTRTRPVAVIAEDFERFRSEAAGEGLITAFMKQQGYACFGQAMFSFLFVDLTAVRAPPQRSTGFDLAGSQIGALG